MYFYMVTLKLLFHKYIYKNFVHVFLYFQAKAVKQEAVLVN